MLETKTYQPAVALITRGWADDRLEISRLLAAAVVNTEFCHLLLQDPALALKNGFQGETFSFTNDERDIIQSIRADSLADLANQLARTFNGHLHQRVKPSVQPSDCFGF